MRESELLTRRECEEIFETVRHAARAGGADQVEAMLAAGNDALTRFANNGIHQNVAEQGRVLSVRTQFDQRTARATTNRLDQDSIRKAVDEAIAITRSQEPDPELLAMPDGIPIPEVSRHDTATARCSPAERGAAVAEAIRLVESSGQTAAGIYATNESVTAILNSRGLFGYHCETMARFSITAMASDSSGWAKASSTSRAAIDPVALARSASQKAALSAAPRELEPGRYTVILEPAATLDLVGQMFADFGGTSLADQRSFLTGRLGQKLFGENITIYDDVCHPLQAGAPFDGEGVPRQRLTLVERGVAKEVAYARLSAHRAGAQATGHGFPLPNEHGEMPTNLVIQGGTESLESMIAGMERGILVTRLWYIREVEPYEKMMTGMTRDGTFLVENGRIMCGVRNFRFNQGLVELLKNVESLSPSERAAGEEAIDMVTPAMKVRDFHFTEVTRF